MSGWTTLILPSLQSLGVWSYWIIGLSAMLEAFFVTGVVVPGTLIVDAGGALVRLGTLDFFDLVWFVAIGAVLGGEAGFWLGRHAGTGLRGRWDPSKSRTFRRTEALFQRYGGLALVIGRFMGPVAGLASFAAAMSGMSVRRFRLWNIASAFPYAIAHVAIGYAAGGLLSRIGPLVGRAALLGALVLGVVLLIWFVSAQVRRGLPLVLSALAMLRDEILWHPTVQRLIARHPRSSAMVLRRFQLGRFDGLIVTTFAAVLIYLAVAWADSVLDFLWMPQVAETDLRLARLVHAFWTPELLHVFGLVTQLGHWPVVLAVFLGVVIALLLTGRVPSVVQLCVALGGELITVRLLKGAFARPRPELSYFVETSGSFPSGHATLAVAFWATLCVILWRERMIGATLALVLGGTVAFLIGFSRIYLIEHFLSDVLNGWLVGGMWLVIGFASAEWMRARRPAAAPVATARSVLAGLVLIVATGLGGYALVTANPPRVVAETPIPAEVIDPAAIAGTPAFPLGTESLTGTPMAPVSVIAVATDIGALNASLAEAGWDHLGAVTLSTVIEGVWSDWRDRLSANAPMLPAFWNGRPQLASYRDAMALTAMRVWSAGHTRTGQEVFAISLSAGGAPADWTLPRAVRQLVSSLRTGPVQEIAAPQRVRDMAPGWDGRTAIVEVK